MQPVSMIVNTSYELYQTTEVTPAPVERITHYYCSGRSMQLEGAVRGRVFWRPPGPPNGSDSHAGDETSEAGFIFKTQNKR
jgi:hypothetical protein